MPPSDVLPALLVGAVVSFALTPLVIRFATARDLLDRLGSARRVHTVAVPRLGGVAVFAGMCAAVAIVWSSAGSGGIAGPPAYRLLLGAAVMFVAGLVDDLRGLSPRAKVAAQFVATLVVFAGGLRPTAIALLPDVTIELGWLSFPLLVVWVVGATNAYNLIDGINGLATGAGIVACAAVGALAFALGHHHEMVMAAALAGTLAGFLRYNFPSARIFLGDSGSMTIGFLLATLCMSGARGAGDVVPLAGPVLVLGLPLLDTTLAVLRRWLRGVSMSAADARHIHHRLLARGFSHRRATVTLCALASLLAAFGLALVLTPRKTASAVALVGAVLLAALVVYGTWVLSYHELAIAGSVLRTAAARGRRAIRDQIHTVDTSQAIRAAASLEQVEEVLAHHAPHFGLLTIKLLRERPERRTLALSGRYAAVMKAWRLEYPLSAGIAAPAASDRPGPYTLALWGDASVGRPMSSAERVAHALAPQLERWLTEYHAGEPGSALGLEPAARAAS